MQIYRHRDEQLEVYTTVISPQVCRSTTRHVEADKVVVARVQYQARWPRELDLTQGDLVQVLFREDESWWFGRLAGGAEGYFPAACVEPLQGAESSRATLLRRGSMPAMVQRGGAPCGCTRGRITPRLLRKHSIQRPLDPGEGPSPLDPGPLGPPHQHQAPPSGAPRSGPPPPGPPQTGAPPPRAPPGPPGSCTACWPGPGGRAAPSCPSTASRPAQKTPASSPTSPGPGPGPGPRPGPGPPIPGPRPGPGSPQTCSWAQTWSWACSENPGFQPD
ncbi:uncharacterized protein ACNS7B_020538 [Menidia menidia]